MRTTTGLRTLAVALLTGATLSTTATGTFATAAPPTYAEGHRGGPIRGTVVSRTPIDVRAAPTTHSAAVDRLSPGSRDRVTCKVRGQSVNGNPNWYWLTGARGWVSAAFVDTGRRSVPACADPCRQWKNVG